MKKSYLLLFLAAMFMAVGAKAVTVDYTGMTTHNPFAYDVTATKTSAGVDVTYKLVGRPTAVSVELYKDGQLVKAVDGDITANTNTASIPMTELLSGTYKVAVKVTGSAVSAPTKVKNGAGTEFEYKFYSPWGAACNNCPESPTFGRVMVTESRIEQRAATYMSGTGNGVGMGLYAFTPTFEGIKNSNNTYGFNLGLTPAATANCDYNWDLRRVKYTDDGRLFVSRTDNNTSSVYEVNSDMVANPFFTGGFIDTKNGGRMYTSEGGDFIAGPALGFDFVGSGDNLKMVVVSKTILDGNVVVDASNARVDAYNIGTATSWASAPSKNILNGKYLLNQNSNVAINDNVILVTQYRGAPNANEPAVISYNWDGSELSKDISTVVRAGAVCFNKERSRFAMASASKTVSVYTVNESTGAISSPSYTTVMTGNNVGGLAWDYADNLYVSSASSETVHCYAMPRSSLDVTTPARAEYDINWESSVPDVYILGTVNGNTWAPNVGVQMTYDATSSSYTATVTAGAGGASFNMATALGESDDWNAFNGHNYRWGVQGGGDHNVADAEYGTDLGAQMWDYTPGAWVVPEGEYNITWKFTGEYTATINIEKIEAVPDVYILGQVNGNAWAPNVGVEMTYDEATGLHSADVFVCKASDSDNYGYFSFTTALAEEGGDAHWADIAANRFGAVSEGDFLVDPYLGQEISLTATNGQSLKCTAGYYTVTVDYKNMKAVVSAKSFAPSFNPEPGEYYKVVNIDIASEAAPDADIYVTFHGETPTTESFQLTKALTLTHSYTVKAIAVKYGIVSDVATGEYTITDEVEIDPSQFELTKVMETTDVPAATDSHFSTGFGDYLYTTERTAQKIVRIDKDGNRSDWHTLANLVNNTMWYDITSDDAGNIIVGGGSAWGTNCWRQLVIVEPDGTEHALNLTLPEGVTGNTRSDNLGRVVGNVMSAEGAYLYVAVQNQTKAFIYKIANGAQVSVTTSPEMGITPDATSPAQPSKWTVSDIETNGITTSFFTRIRGNRAVYKWKADNSAMEQVAANTSASTTDGFDIFELAGEVYVVEASGTNYKDGYTIRKLSDNSVVAQRAETVSNTSTAYQSLTARVSEDGSYATIYQTLGGHVSSIYRYGMPPTGVEKVGNDSQAKETSVDFYNLQGQRIVNPQAGQIAIRVAKMSDGTLRTTKVLVK